MGSCLFINNSQVSLCPVIKYTEKTLSLGNQPISNRFVSNKDDDVPCFPLEFSWNDTLGCMMLDTHFPVDEVRPRFDWITCFEPEDHLDELVNNIIKVCDLTAGSRISGYSFKDDSTLARLDGKGCKNTWRIDPKVDLGADQPLANIETLQEAFNSSNVKLMIRRRDRSDVVIARHVVEHAYRLGEWLSCLGEMLTDDGYVVLEIPDCERAMVSGDCTILWEEHTAYFNAKSFRALLRHCGFSVVYEKVYFYPLENSIVFIARKSVYVAGVPKVDFEPEREIFRNFCESISRRALKTRARLEGLRESRGQNGIFGAGHLSIAFLSYNEVSHLVSACFDDNPHKVGMFLPVGGVPIIGSDCLNFEQYPICLLGLNPQHHGKIRNVLSDYVKQGGQLISIFPETAQNIDEIL